MNFTASLKLSFHVCSEISAALQWLWLTEKERESEGDSKAAITHQLFTFWSCLHKILANIPIESNNRGLALVNYVNACFKLQSFRDDK